MLQPRRYKLKGGIVASCLLFLVFIHSVLGTEKEAYRDPEDEPESDNLGDEISLTRVKRDDSGLTTVLLISNDDDNRYGKSARPSGVLTSTARTFVHDGTTTEYGTQVIGTTLDQGKYYAQILQTSSRIYFGSQEKSSTKSKSDERAYYKSRYIGLPQNVDNFIQSSVFQYIQPSEPVFIYPTRGANSGGSVKLENRDGKSGSSSTSNQSPPQGNDSRIDGSSTTSSSTSSSSSSSSANGGGGSRSHNNGKEVFISQIGPFSTRSKESGDRDLLENLIRLENIDVFNKRKVEEIKANRASSNQLPTYTIRHDFAPSGFSVSSEDEREERLVKNEKSKLRSGKGLFNKPTQVKYDTVTYLGFADFVTTVGSTVIVFMPSTRSGSQPVTQSPAQQTSVASQKVDPHVQTTIKTFLSHSQGMVTQTVPGHSLNMETVLPTSVADRKNKGLSEDLELKSSVLAKEQILFENPVFTTHLESSEVLIEPSETMTYSSISRASQVPTEPLATFATTVTRTFGTGGSDKPLGLLKSIGGTKAYNGTTTHFTSLIYGTYVDGSYAQVLKTSSSVYYIIEDGGGISATVVLDRPTPTSTAELKTDSPATTDVPTATTEGAKTTTEGEDELLETSDADYDDEEEKTTMGVTNESVTGSNEIHKARKINLHSKQQSVSGGDDSKGKKKEGTAAKDEVYHTKTSDELITRLVPSTVYKTFTYLTTFFIPADETTTTSIRSREVVTSDVSLLTKIIDPNLVSEQVFPTSSVIVTTPSNVVDDSDSDEEFRLPVVRLLAPESAVVVEDTTDEDTPNETTTSTPTTTLTPDEESTTEDASDEGFSTLKTTLDAEATESGTTLFDSTTEASTLPSSPTTPDTTDPAVTTSSHLEETPQSDKTPTTNRTKQENEKKTVASDEADDEVEVIFKTLFTTYTYLTTFFHESTTSISSSEVVVTNVITSTLDIHGEKSSRVVPQTASALKEPIQVTRTPSKNVFANDDDDNGQFFPTSVITGGSETKFFDDDEDEDEFTLSPSKEVSGGEVTETPHLAVKNLKTLYTTYTYYTTLVDEGSTQVKTRTEVVTNVLGPTSLSVLPSSILQNEALFKSKFEMLLREQQRLRDATQNNGGVSSTAVKPTAKGSSLYTSFTPSSSAHRFSASSSSVQPSSTFLSSKSRTDSSSRLLSSTRGTSFQRFSIRPSASVKTRFGPFTRRFSEQVVRTNNGQPVPAENDEDNSVTRLIIKGDKKDRTVIRKRIRTKARPLPRPADVDEGLGITTFRLDPTPPEGDLSPLQTMVTDVRSTSSKGGRQIRVAPPEPLERIGEEFYDDQVSSESNTDEIQPSPTLVLQTSYTTFTYFTTVYKGASSSDVISRLETVTNIVTETVKPEFLATQTLSPEDATLPITYFTTFTYWTTLYKDGNTVITSREETVSNVVTPTIEPSSTTILEKTVTPVSPETTASFTTTSTSTSDAPVIPSIFIPGFIPAATPDPVTEPAETETPSPIEVRPIAENTTQPLINTEGLVGKLEPTTYYTTYTYFTTSYVGDSTVLKSRLETVTSVVIPTPSISDITENDLQTGRAINSGSSNAVGKSDQKDNSENPFQTGLLSTIVSTAVDDGKTTLYSTDIFGTFIDGLYAKVLESTTKIVSSAEVTPTTSSEVQKTGIVSINEGSIVDADGISTTFFTTKAIGTSIEQLYAQVVESTTSVLVDNDKKSALASLSESQGEDSQKTGLLLLTEGSIIQDGTTTLYESRLIGTIIDGSYVQIVESTSSYKIEPSIAPSVTIHSEVTPTSTVELTSPSPSAVEGSITEDIKMHEDDQSEVYEDGEEDDDEEGGKGRLRSRLTFQSKKRTFTPVIRPFASRNRPTFLPKKKPVGTTGAQTITRANFTPTITATLATKTEGFAGSSRNRFGNNRKSSAPIVGPEVKPTAANSRKFGRNRTTFSSPTISSSYGPTRGRGTSARVSPTPTLNFNSARNRANFKTSSRAFGFESGTIRPSLPGSRPRIRPTSSGLPGRGLGAATASTNLPNDKVNDLTTVVTEDEEGSFTSEDDGVLITTTSTTTEDPNLARRNNNPLLRFRRPILPKVSTTTTTPKPTTTPAPRRGILAGRNNRLPAPPPNTSSRNAARTPLNIGRNNLANRSRPNNLFPPRGLFKKPTPQEAEKEEDEFLDEEEETVENEDSNFEESSAKEVEADVEINANERNTRGRGYNPVQIRPFNFQRRSKRQAVEYGTRKFSSESGSYKYRRPKVKPVQAQERLDYYDDEVTPSEPPKTPRTGRIYTPRTRGQTYQAQTTNPPTQSRIRPTPASSQNSPRAPFTIREKESSANPRTSNFRRGQNPSSRRKSSTYKGSEPTVTRKTGRTRGQSQNQALNDLTRVNQRRGYSNGRRVSSSRGRLRFGESEDPFTYQTSVFDGTITVTHKIPSEVTIPIVNGRVTEYRNVITAKPSIEILGPHQYTVSSTNGGTVLFLNREVTETLSNGATEITKFLVHETPTTSVIFTPTTIRGRKTSFSHIIPSTVYDVENIVTTIQPQIAANAPLANILLSQLLLGNLNVPVPPNQPLGIPQQPLNPVTPTTEYKTRTTTYVTSVTDQISTVLPITFRGKEILTTIVDNTVNIITATEYITDTIVVTPTLNPNQQINSLLLPALLQAQLLNTNQQVTPPQLPIPGFTQLPFTPALGLDPLKFEALQPQDIKIEDLTDDKTKLSRDNDIRLERESDTENIEEEDDDGKLSQKSKDRNKADKKRLEAEPAKEIITLYVSGRRPGEFSTILSTVTTGETSVAVRKREAAMDDIDRLVVEASEAKQVRVQASKQLTLDEERYNQKQQEPSYLDLYVTPGMPEVVIPVESQEINSETQSLESVLGDVSKHVTESAKATPATKAFVKPTRNDYQKNSKKSSAKHSGPKLSKENY